MTKTSSAPWITVTPDYGDNINNMPEEIWGPYIDQFVAYSLDGKEILAGGNSYEELFNTLDAKQIDKSRVVIGHVDDPNKLYFGPFK